MGVHLETKSDVAILKIGGSFVGDNDADKLYRTTRNLIADGNTALVFDVGGVHRMNSRTLGVLVSTHANYVNRGGRIIIVNLDKNLEDILTITRLVRVFEICPTLQDALRELAVSA